MRLLRRGLECHVCTINKNAHAKKVWKLFDDSRIYYAWPKCIYIYIYIYILVYCVNWKANLHINLLNFILINNSESGSNGNKGVLQTSQMSRTRASPSDTA